MKATKWVIISCLMLSSFVQAPMSIANASTRTKTARHSRKIVSPVKKYQIAKKIISH